MKKKDIVKLRRSFRRSKATIRTVRTVYYADYEATVRSHTNNSQYPNRAAVAAHEHLRACKYMAVLAEVHDEITGKLYAVIRMDLDGSVHTVYQDIADQIDLIRGV